MATAYMQPAPNAVQPAEHDRGAEDRTLLLPVVSQPPYFPTVQPLVEKRQDRSTKLWLGTLNTLQFRVLRAIPVQLNYGESGVVASWDEIDEFGTGDSASSACVELSRTVAELYRSLQQEQERLGPDLQRVFSKLQEYILPRP
jgi:hypothetical protein